MTNRCGLLKAIFLELTYVFVLLDVTVDWIGAAHSAKDVPVYYVEGVVGDQVFLPCDISAADGPKEDSDAVVLVLWYREDLGTPIYSIDTREKEIKNAGRWSDDKVFGHRAYFIPEKEPAQLAVDNVKETDENLYRCRVDFKYAQTRNSKVYLNVTVPPQKILITDQSGHTRTSVVGPYTVGSSLILKCYVSGGKPAPTVIWYKGDEVMTNKTFSKIDNPVDLELQLHNLRRSDLHSELSCQASNNNRTQPLTAIVQIDMNFSPLDVRILNSNQSLTAGRRYDLFCQSSGSRPPAKLTWWKDDHRLDKTKDTTSADGNTTTSSLSFIPTKQDTGKYLSCRSENPDVSKEYLDTSWKLNIYYVPEVKLMLGTSLKPDTIREGVDVYFDCYVNALPAAHKVEWKQNGKLLHHNVGQGVIISNQSLVLQRVSRSSAGNYTCVAHNSEGEGVSNNFNLNVMYSPTCKANQTRVYGVAKMERANITCEVDANPGQVQFKWAFNNSAESLNVLANHISCSGTASMVTHMPASDLDYGTLLCWASNKIGQQITPCVFHVIVAGKPDKTSNCSIWNITTVSLTINCLEGYNGGMPQTFWLEVTSTTAEDSSSGPTDDEGDNDYDDVAGGLGNIRKLIGHTGAAAVGRLKANVSSNVPKFVVHGLQPGTRYVAAVYSANVKGRSEPSHLEFTTLGKRELTQNLKEEMHHEESFQLSTTMSVVIGVSLSLIFVACIAATILQLHCSRRMENRRSNKRKLRTDAVFSSNDSVSSSEKTRDATATTASGLIIAAGGGGGVAGVATAVAAADKQLFIGGGHVSVLVTDAAEERDPDLIPQPIIGNEEIPRIEFVNRKQCVSTIDANVVELQNMFHTADNNNHHNAVGRHYPTSYCTLRNGTVPMQDLSHLSAANHNVMNIPPPQNNGESCFPYGNCSTLPRRNWQPPPPCMTVVPNEIHHRHHHQQHHLFATHRPCGVSGGPIACVIPEEEISPSSTPLISPKHESAV